MPTRFATVGARLATAFGATIAVFLFVVTVGLVKLSQLQDRLHSITDENNVEMQMAFAMRIAVNQVAIEVRNLVVQKNEALAQAELDAMATSRKNYDAADEKLGRMFATLNATPRERELYAAIRQLRDATRPLNNQVVALRKEGKYDEAAALLAEKVGQAQKQWLHALGDLADVETQLNDEAAAEANAAYASAQRLMIGLSIAGLGVALVLSIRMSRNLRRELGGEPAYAAEIARAIAAGNLAIEVEVNDRAEGSLLLAMKQMQRSLATIVATIRTGAESIATGSAQIAGGNADLSQRTEEQAANLEQTAASMEELAGAVNNNADAARQATELVKAAKEATGRGSEVVRKAVQTMDEIDQASARIGDIIGVIDGVAFQTNILALNAAVEAARAGEQGRGFAVVATEVRSLAGRSAAAAREIKQLIAHSGANVAKGESARDLWRLQPLRRWSHEQVEQVLT